MRCMVKLLSVYTSIGLAGGNDKPAKSLSLTLDTGAVKF